MADPVKPPTLAPEIAARFAEFARACKAAARAVSLYPGSHPAIGASLGRLAEATLRLTEQRALHAPGPRRRAPARRRAGGQARSRRRRARRGPASPPDRHADASTPGRTPTRGARSCSCWRDRRTKSAPTAASRSLWATAGGPSLEIVEIDYAEVLREKQGQAATIDQILAAALGGPQLAARRHGDARAGRHRRRPRAARRADAAARAARRRAGASTSRSPPSSTSLRGLADYVARTTPETARSDASSRWATRPAGSRPRRCWSCSSSATGPKRWSATVDVIGAMVHRMSDTVGRGVRRRTRSSPNAARPIGSRRRSRRSCPTRIASGSSSRWPQTEVANSELGEEAVVPGAVAAGRGDADLVLGRELRVRPNTGASSERRTDARGRRRRRRATIRRSGSTAWLTTVSDGALRGLDHHCCSTSSSSRRTRALARHRADRRHPRRGSGAGRLLRPGAGSSRKRSSIRRPSAPIGSRTAAPCSSTSGAASMMKHVAAHLRTADDEGYERFKRLATRSGPR